MNYERINQAVRFATIAHEGQKRKATTISYISHPYTATLYVMDALKEVALNEQLKEDIVVATLLHDVVEDTDCDIKTVENTFGKEVASLVAQVSEPHKEKPWKERKQHTIDKIKHAPLKVKCIICADKTHNLLSILQDYEQNGDDVWKRFNAPKSEQQWYYSSIADALIMNTPHPPSLFTNYKKLVTQLFQI
jgi:(p)ppGpp synthase/HD superfamily hydrolase